jgi:hypothetical protein
LAADFPLFHLLGFYHAHTTAISRYFYLLSKRFQCASRLHGGTKSFRGFPQLDSVAIIQFSVNCISLAYCFSDRVSLHLCIAYECTISNTLFRAGQHMCIGHGIVNSVAMIIRSFTTWSEIIHSAPPLNLEPARP